MNKTQISLSLCLLKLYNPQTSSTQFIVISNYPELQPLTNTSKPKSVVVTPQCPECERESARYSSNYYRNHDLSLFLCGSCYPKQDHCNKCNAKVSTFHKKGKCSDCRRLFCYPKCIKGCAGCGDSFCDNCPHSCHGC